ncbi:MAG: UDP-N-acetylmuramoyl-tripeptide--D-alanyl-D-alanine ligase [Vicinamibacterales bacterium]
MSALTLTLQWIAEATAGRLVIGDPGSIAGEVVTDTRTIGTGDFFVALRGPRHDGHDHVAAAIRAGASGAVVEREWFDRQNSLGVATEAGGFGVVVVGDTVVALQDMARAVRRAVDTRVVAITGSAGKTTTKETVAGMLATRLTVVKNRGNFNNHIGLPFSLMELRRRPDVAVMELGMNHSGEISTLVGIADPDVRVWTNVGDAHLGFFASPDAIADAKAEILEGADAADLLVCNADDPRVMARVCGFPGRTVTFGYSPGAQVRAVDVEDRGVSGMRARLVTPVGERPLEIGLLGRGNLANVLAAAAVAIHFDIPLDVIVGHASLAKPAERRGAVLRAHGLTVIDDSYNSSPTALLRALEVMRNERGTGRKGAVLGEMLELGDHADRLHRECGEAAATAGLAWLVTVGGAAAKALADSALNAGMAPDAVTWCERSAAAADYVAGLVRPGDLVLVKGSRGIRTDVVVDRLTAGGA